jgi:hypothetical protein
MSKRAERDFDFRHRQWMRQEQTHLIRISQRITLLAFPAINQIVFITNTGFDVTAIVVTREQLEEGFNLYMEPAEPDYSI